MLKKMLWTGYFWYVPPSDLTIQMRNYTVGFWRHGICTRKNIFNIWPCFSYLFDTNSTYLVPASQFSPSGRTFLSCLFFCLKIHRGISIFSNKFISKRSKNIVKCWKYFFLYSMTPTIYCALTENAMSCTNLYEEDLGKHSILLCYHQ